MNLNFPTNDLIDRARGASRIATSSRASFPILTLPEVLSPAARPFHPRLIGPGAALLIAVLATDIAFAHSLLFQWENFSIWLLTGGLILAALAGLALVLDVALHRITGIDWLRFAGFSAAVLLSLFNALVHSRDAYTAVVPAGLELSALVSAILVILGWRGWSVGARNASPPLKSEEIH